MAGSLTQMATFREREQQLIIKIALQFAFQIIMKPVSTAINWRMQIPKIKHKGSNKILQVKN